VIARLPSPGAGAAGQFPGGGGRSGEGLALWGLAPAAATPVDLTGLLQHAAQMASLAGYAEQAVSLARRAITSAGPAVNPLAAGSLRSRLATYL
jgi:hypothetical protein